MPKRIITGHNAAGRSVIKINDDGAHGLNNLSELWTCQRRSKISPPGRSKTSPLNVMRYAVLGGCPGSP